MGRLHSLPNIDKRTVNDYLIRRIDLRISMVKLFYVYLVKCWSTFQSQNFPLLGNTTWEVPSFIWIFAFFKQNVKLVFSIINKDWASVTHFNLNYFIWWSRGNKLMVWLHIWEDVIAGKWHGLSELNRI